MKIVMIMLLICSLLVIPVSASELTAPTVPQQAAKFMPSEPQNLTEGIRQVLKEGIAYLRPDLKEAAAIGIAILAVVMLCCLIRELPGSTVATVRLASCTAIAGILLKSSGSMLNLAVETVQQTSEYGKLLLPVMTTALAAQGHVTSSSALYAGTALFSSFLSGLIAKLLCPLTYLYLALATAHSALGEEQLKGLRDCLKGTMVWILKTVLYVFTGYISITGVVSGTTDASALKVAKLTISGAVPVVGGILSDASEAVLVGVGTAKNAAGIYGIFALLAIVLGPFLTIGIHYLILKLTAGLSAVFGSRECSGLIQDFSTAMGLLLAMTGAVSLMLMISLVCFMKGAA